MIKFFMEVKQRNSKNSYLVNQISEILNYENLKITKIIEELKQETPEDPILKTMILNHVYPDKNEKQYY